MKIKIVVNGTEEILEQCTLKSLINTKTENQDSLVVEYNYKIITSKVWEETLLQEGDNLELLSFVGGG